jgi:hypothetical protein
MRGRTLDFLSQKDARRLSGQTLRPDAGRNVVALVFGCFLFWMCSSSRRVGVPKAGVQQAHQGSILPESTINFLRRIRIYVGH